MAGSWPAHALKALEGLDGDASELAEPMGEDEAFSTAFAENIAELRRRLAAIG